MLRRALLYAIVLCLALPMAAYGVGYAVVVVGGGLGTGTATSISQEIQAIAASDGVVYMADSRWAVIRRLDIASGTESLVAGNGVFGEFPSTYASPALDSPLGGVFGLAIAGGSLYFSDATSNVVCRIDRDGLVRIVAGKPRRSSDSPSFGGDGGRATDALLSYPQGITLGTDGSLFIADMGNDVVRKVDPSGVISTVAGQAGKSGYTSDGIPAAAATLNQPTHVSVDRSGNLLIADSKNYRLRRVDSNTGIISTIAGNGSAPKAGEPSYDGSAALDVPATPEGVVAEGDAVVFADVDGARVRKVDSGGKISTIAGNGRQGYSGDGGTAKAASLEGPIDVARVDSALVISGVHVRSVSATGKIATIAGTDSLSPGDNGPAAHAQLLTPQDMAVDDSGSVYTLDVLTAQAEQRRVRRIDRTGTISTFAGTAPPSSSDSPVTTAAQVMPTAIAVARTGTVFLGDEAHVYRVDRSGVVRELASGFRATAMTVDAAENVYVVDATGDRAWKVPPSGKAVVIAGSGPGPCQTVHPIPGHGGSCRYGGFSGDGGPAVNAQFDAPSGIAVDDRGSVYIADTGNARVRKVDGSGVVASLPQYRHGNDSDPIRFGRLVIDAAGSIFAANMFVGAELYRFDRAWSTVDLAPFHHEGAHRIADPWQTQGLAIDAGGDLLTVDRHRVLRIKNVGTPRRNVPAGIAEPSQSGRGSLGATTKPDAGSIGRPPTPSVSSRAASTKGGSGSLVEVIAGIVGATGAAGAAIAYIRCRRTL